MFDAAGSLVRRLGIPVDRVPLPVGGALTGVVELEHQDPVHLDRGSVHLADLHPPMSDGGKSIDRIWNR